MISQNWPQGSLFHWREIVEVVEIKENSESRQKINYKMQTIQKTEKREGAQSQEITETVREHFQTSQKLEKGH